MADRLLVVHPSSLYDPRRLVQPAIRELAGRYHPSDIFVLYNDDEPYLGRDDIQNALRSDKGEIADTRFLRMLMDSEQVTICGHVHGSCHYTAFAELADEYEKFGAGTLRIVIPTRAVSVYPSNLPLTVRIEQTEDWLREALRQAYYQPDKNSYPWNVSRVMMPHDAAVLSCMRGYVGHLLDASFPYEITVDENMMARRGTNPSQRLALAIKTQG